MDGSNNTVGGMAAGAGNLISANQGSGVSIVGPGGGNLVQGNLIGTDVSGTRPLGNARDGVHLDGTNSGRNNTVGGEAFVPVRNTIAFNGGDGVLVDRGTGNAVLANAIFANGRLGIELVRGGNHDQAFPVITSATTDGASTTVEGTLASTPDSAFTVEFFANTVCDPSGFGQGERFLGSAPVTTDADGQGIFTVTLATGVDPGQFLSATATDPAGNTSQFAACVEVTGGGPPGAGAGPGALPRGEAAPATAGGEFPGTSQAGAGGAPAAGVRLGDASALGDGPDLLFGLLARDGQRQRQGVASLPAAPPGPYFFGGLDAESLLGRGLAP
jgi:hypothetical protein